MASSVFSNQIRDTNTYTFQQDRSDGTSVVSLFHLVNGLDAEVTVTYYGTRSADASAQNEIIQIGSNTVASNSEGYDTLSDPWDIVYIEIVATTTPTSGSMDVYRMQ